MKVLSVFVAHAKSDSDVATRVLVDAFTGQFIKQASLRFTLGREDYNKNFAKAGGWDGWTRSIVYGRAYGTTRRRYDVILVPQSIVGKATADIVRFALEARTMVVVLDRRDGGWRFKKVVAVMNRGEGGFQAGWEVRT